MQRTIKSFKCSQTFHPLVQVGCWLLEEAHERRVGAPTSLAAASTTYIYESRLGAGLVAADLAAYFEQGYAMVASWTSLGPAQGARGLADPVPGEVGGVGGAPPG